MKQARVLVAFDTCERLSGAQEGLLTLPSTITVQLHLHPTDGSHCKRCACNPAFHDTFVLVRARYRRRQEIVGALSINRQDLGEIPKVTLQGYIEVDVKFSFTAFYNAKEREKKLKVVSLVYMCMVVLEWEGAPLGYCHFLCNLKQFSLATTSQSTNVC